MWFNQLSPTWQSYYDNLFLENQGFFARAEVRQGGWQQLLLLSKQRCSGHIAKRLLLAHALLKRLMMATGLSLQ